MGNKWTDNEKAFVQNNAPAMTIRQLANGLKDNIRSNGAVWAMCKKLGVNPLVSPHQKAWTDHELQFLKDNKSMKMKQLCEELGKSYKAVATKLCRTKKLDMEQVTPWMNTLLEWVKDKKSIYDLSIELYDNGTIVEIRTNSEGKMALFAKG